MVRHRDANLTPGSIHTYSVAASDGTNTSARSAESAPIKVSAHNPSLTYENRVLGAAPSFLWTLGQTSGSTATDATPHHFNGVYEPGTTKGRPGPIAGSTAKATAFDGKTGLVTAAKAVQAPAKFSIELWFKTGTNTGGSLVGFGSTKTGASSNYDREVYLMNDGQLSFGVYSGSSVHVIESPHRYNDSQWHYVVGTLGPSGLALYIDGKLVGTDPTTTAQAYTGYWRAGDDNLFGYWDLDDFRVNSQGTSQPYDYHYTGTIADVAVYPVALTAAQVANHYAANYLQH